VHSNDRRKSLELAEVEKLSPRPAAKRPDTDDEGHYQTAAESHDEQVASDDETRPADDAVQHGKRSEQDIHLREQETARDTDDGAHGLEDV
jgi:hypothetical protein